MSDFGDFKVQIAEWANRQDWSDGLITSFIRMAEQKFNQDLRVDRMIQYDEAIILDRSAPVPSDWLAFEVVSIANINAANGFLPIRYKSRDEFLNLPDTRALYFYTIEGRQIIFGGTPDAINGIRFRVVYFGEVPIFTDLQQSWIYTKYPSLYLLAALMHADLHAVGEEDKALALKAQVDDAIGKLNAQYLVSKASGSRITRTRRRSFG